MSRYFGSSLKGEAAIDWDEQETTRGVVDGDRAGCPAAAGIGRADAQAAHPQQAETIATAAALLRRLIAQDVEEKPGGGCQEIGDGEGPAGERA